MTYWNTFKNFINTKEVGSIITRSELMKKAFPSYGEVQNFDGTMVQRVDQFRWMLTRAKYLKFIKPGSYELVDKVPEDITIEECISLVKRDNFTYIKLLEKRRKKRKKEQTNEATI